ncbi:DUF1403 family protein [Pseudooceanicola sp. 216_PA32_1]|uniref:DUF1403 family protein n=1 Tax=Pseudooceanicola pacificus TaxID=2676438 RepID=A0A844W473_9RHOB|nr:DUF1403 family protein [Pseudooceanicola pacificus]MWB79016.1 DUF1403 family protein [Pseudooceanicola pacificus]
MPSRVTSGRAETLETVSFRSGTALTVHDQLVSDPKHGVPVKLRANLLALGAATATSKPQGRRAREMNIRHIHRKYLNNWIESDRAAMKQRLRHIPGVQTLAAKLSAPSERASSRIVMPARSPWPPNCPRRPRDRCAKRRQVQSSAAHATDPSNPAPSLLTGILLWPAQTGNIRSGAARQAVSGNWEHPGLPANPSRRPI